MKKDKKNNRVWIIITIVVAVVCLTSCIATAIFVLVSNNIKDTNELKALNEQVNKISEIGYQNNVVNLDGIKSEMSSDITTGKRKVVEEALDEYTFDLYSELNNTITILNDEKVTTLLSPENITADGKEFKTSKVYIEEKKKAIADNKEKLNNLLKEENIMKYIEKKKTSSKYEEMYKVLTIGTNGIPESDILKLNQLIDKNIKVLEISEEAINLLSSNQDKWNLSNNQVMFTDQGLLDKYNAIIKQQI
jgi:hypothetical protein